jgi:hypothetical protein
LDPKSFNRLEREVVTAEGNILSRRHDGLAAGRAENVQGRHHQQTGLQLRLDREGHVHRHLVAVKVRVVSGADQGMDANGLTFDEDGLESLN